MAPLRERIKRALPAALKDALVAARDRLAPPPLEDIVLHGYELVVDPCARRRLTLVIPTISPRKAFGGIATGLEIFLEIGKRTGADLRVLLDDFERSLDTSVVEKCARIAGVQPAVIDIVPRTDQVPRVGVRSADIFYTFNWWTTLNIRPLLREQLKVYGGTPRPHLYAIQEYDPHFDPFSSTHMMARLSYEPRWPCWGLFNSSELYNFFTAQGHRLERSFVFEPQLSRSLRPFLGGETPTKVRRILVYSRPSVPRNCYPAIEKGLKLWAQRYPEASRWEVVSAGLPHPALVLGARQAMRSLGKLSLEAYGELLRTTAVGLSLMASPHPSYPPLEMAHFGVRTITNRYANKDLTTTHPNILSIDDLVPDTIADALATACQAFEADPTAAWLAPTLRPSFLTQEPFPFLDELAAALNHEVWGDAHLPRDTQQAGCYKLA